MKIVAAPAAKVPKYRAPAFALLPVSVGGEVEDVKKLLIHFLLSHFQGGNRLWPYDAISIEAMSVLKCANYSRRVLSNVAIDTNWSAIDL